MTSGGWQCNSDYFPNKRPNGQNERSHCSNQPCFQAVSPNSAQIWEGTSESCAHLVHIWEGGM